MRVGLRRARSTATSTAIVVGAALLLSACGVPIPEEVPDTSGPRGDGAAEVDRLVPRDERTDELASALRVLTARLVEARDLLADGDGAAVGVLIGEAGGGTDPGVLPAVEPDRAGLGSDDLVNTVVTLAGDVGGERSRIVLELVRDPMLGDLGAWQRDPVGVIALLRATAEATVTDGAAVDGTPDAGLPAALDASLLEVPGELSRALGYAFVVAASDDPILTAHAAKQGSGRIGVVLVALELAIERLEAIDAEATAGADR